MHPATVAETNASQDAGLTITDQERYGGVLFTRTIAATKGSPQ